jgi:hypothetical protein
MRREKVPNSISLVISRTQQEYIPYRTRTSMRSRRAKRYHTGNVKHAEDDLLLHAQDLFLVNDPRLWLRSSQ